MVLNRGVPEYASRYIASSLSGLLKMLGKARDKLAVLTSQQHHTSVTPVSRSHLLDQCNPGAGNMYTHVCIVSHRFKPLKLV